MGAIISKCRAFISSESARQSDDMKADWSKMPPDLLELISERLPLLDFIAFRSVCPHWRSAPSDRSEVTKFSKDQPWLIFYGTQSNRNRRGACYFYSHSHSKCCTVYLPELQDATVMESKFGWLLSHRGEHFFLVNFFTYEIISIPNHASVSNQVCTFTTFPTNKDCTVFIVSRSHDSVIEVSSCRIHADEAWTVQTLNISSDVIGTMIGAYCCSCSYDHRHCKCQLKNKIAILGLEHWACFDYVNGKLTGHVHRKQASGKGDTWFDDVSNANGSDWFDRFGENGISVSLSAQSVSNGTSFGRTRGVRTHTASGKPEPNINQLKGAAVTPTFFWKDRRRAHSYSQWQT